MIQFSARQDLRRDVGCINSEAVLTRGTQKVHSSFVWLVSFENRSFFVVVAVCATKVRRLSSFELFLECIRDLAWTNTHKLILTKQIGLRLRSSKRFFQISDFLDQRHLFQLTLHHLLLQIQQSAGQVHNASPDKFLISKSDQAFCDISYRFRACESSGNPVNHFLCPLSFINRMVHWAKRCIA